MTLETEELEGGGTQVRQLFRVRSGKPLHRLAVRLIRRSFERPGHEGPTRLEAVLRAWARYHVAVPGSKTVPPGDVRCVRPGCAPPQGKALTINTTYVNLSLIMITVVNIATRSVMTTAQ